MRPNTLIDSMREREPSILADIHLIAWTALAALMCPFLAAAVAIAVMR